MHQARSLPAHQNDSVQRASQIPFDLPGTSKPYKKQAPLLPNLFLFSLALFAFWLRSSVVSVLFSLISEISLR